MKLFILVSSFMSLISLADVASEQGKSMSFSQNKTAKGMVVNVVLEGDSARVLYESLNVVEEVLPFGEKVKYAPGIQCSKAAVVGSNGKRAFDCSFHVNEVGEVERGWLYNEH